MMIAKQIFFVSMLRMNINPARIYALNKAAQGNGPVIYWMSREQRVRDNWGLLHARELAGSGPLIVAFCLVGDYPGATLRHYDFMLRGLMEVERDLKKYGVSFALLEGDPGIELPRFAAEIKAGAVVTDFDPLRIKQQWQQQVAERLTVPLLEVDGHNVIPTRRVSDKQEYAARTIRTKLQRLSSEYFEPFPNLAPVVGDMLKTPTVDWEAILDTYRGDESVLPVKFEPGEAAASRALKEFIGKRLPGYDTKRNDPVAEGTSRLSPYFHFGQLAPHRAALDVAATGQGEAQAAYLEELITRRELTDNYCLFNPQYDSLEGAPEWARKTLDEHRDDPRPYLYAPEQFERAQTHSRLWNAAQMQLLKTGLMHGYLRMFWAKKVLEWSPSPEEALATVIRLNDRYALDGRDPNGYVGALWSIAGLHDRPWKTRPVYGSVRYMNENGCRRKFDVDAYIGRWLENGPVPHLLPL